MSNKKHVLPKEISLDRKTESFLARVLRVPKKSEESKKLKNKK